MSWKTTFDGQFGLFDSQEVACGTVGAPGILPQPSKPLNVNAEQIMVQANENNPGVVVFSQAACWPSGLRLAPGGSQVLPDNQYTKWQHYATQPGCTFTVVYVAGPK